MKFTRELPPQVNVIRSHSTGELRIGERLIHSGCLLSADQLIADWEPHSASEVSTEHFTQAFEWRPEIILLGTGTHQQFPSREIYAAILGRGIGFEVMDTGAACRTFNVLVAERRRVVAGLIV